MDSVQAERSIKQRDGWACGIDPGKDGGFCRIKFDAEETIETYRMEDVPTAKDKWDLIRSWTETSETMTLERVSGFSRGGRSNGGAGMFKFGYGAGGLEMALIAAGARHQIILPQKWQAPFSLKKRKGETDTEKKNRHKAAAQALFPKVKVTHKIADAILIAHWTRLAYIRGEI